MASKEPSAKGSEHASAWWKVRRGSGTTCDLATASMGSARSVATSAAPGGKAASNSFVTMPVPAASSSTRSPSRTFSRRAMSSAYASKMSGPR